MRVSLLVLAVVVAGFGGGCLGPQTLDHPTPFAVSTTEVARTVEVDGWTVHVGNVTERTRTYGPTEAIEVDPEGAVVLPAFVDVDLVLRREQPRPWPSMDLVTPNGTFPLGFDAEEDPLAPLRYGNLPLGERWQGTLRVRVPPWTEAQALRVGPAPAERTVPLQGGADDAPEHRRTQPINVTDRIRMGNLSITIDLRTGELREPPGDGVVGTVLVQNVGAEPVPGDLRLWTAFDGSDVRPGDGINRSHDGIVDSGEMVRYGVRRTPEGPWNAFWVYVQWADDPAPPLVVFRAPAFDAAP